MRTHDASLEPHDHDKGLSHDLATLHARRRMLRWAAGAGLVSLIGCNDDGACPTTPEETEGPYPGDGSNGANVLTLSGVVRSDIRTSIGDANGTAEGIPLTLTLTVVNNDGGCTPVAGYAVYIWHCDREGRYSMYSAGAKSENYLRGVQETADDGTVTFTTTFPGCYDGRWPHIHFEIYPSLDAATDADQKLQTSQLALTQTSCEAAYATTGYEASVTNLSKSSLDDDNVFGDDAAELQLAEISGNVTDGFVASLTISLDV